MNAGHYSLSTTVDALKGHGVSRTITPNRAEELAALTTTYRDAKEAFERHRDRWHNAITEAVDDGMKPADVGHLVGVSPQRIQAIVVRVYSHTD